MSIDNARARNWCFTLNNYTPEEYDAMEDICTRSSYLIIGKEVGSNGTPHLQGYVEYPNATRGSAMRKICPLRKNAKGEWTEPVHWEVRKGTAAQASDYCKKEKDFQEFGSLSQQGKRTDLEEVGAAITSGSSIREIACTYPGTFIKYHKGIEALKDAMYPNDPRIPDKPPCVIWLWGLAGTGKTRIAYESHKTVWLKTTPKWWDGYHQQEAIIIDDFTKKDWDFREFLRVLDRYPYCGEVKGKKDGVEVNSPFIYVTCEYAPVSLWGDLNELEQVERRIRQGGGRIDEIKAPEETKTA